MYYRVLAHVIMEAEKCHERRKEKPKGGDIRGGAEA